MLSAAKAASTMALLVAQANLGAQRFEKLFELHRVRIYTLPSGYFAIDKMRKTQFTFGFNALSQTSTDFAKTSTFSTWITAINYQ